MELPLCKAVTLLHNLGRLVFYSLAIVVFTLGLAMVGLIGLIFQEKNDG